MNSPVNYEQVLRKISPSHPVLLAGIRTTARTRQAWKSTANWSIRQLVVWLQTVENKIILQTNNYVYNTCAVTVQQLGSRVYLGLD